MTSILVNGQEYRLSSQLNSFQLEMQVHLVNWKWSHVTREPGWNGRQPNDALLPDAFAARYPMIYPGILSALLRHKQEYPFRIHRYFNHVASSQAANINLFLPVLLHPRANDVLAAVKPDFARLATGHLDHGFRIEFWDEPFGTLGDKSAMSGTDSDTAIAYYNHNDELCLWLIEHKLTESEFTTCGGFKSTGRQPRHDCGQPFSAILANPDLCYYHNACKFNYWKITAANSSFFANHASYPQCPFQGGLNQLWRNQLLGLGIEQDERQPYRHVTFSVAKHPRNMYLDPSISAYRNLIDDNPKFTVLTSADFVAAAAAHTDPELDRWVDWYRTLYHL